MKRWLIGMMLAAGLSAWAGSVGIPEEHIALPVVENGSGYLVCVWDGSAQAWAQSHAACDNTGTYTLQLPEWDRWYWIGLWDTANKRYVFGQWVGHFKTD